MTYIQNIKNACNLVNNSILNSIEIRTVDPFGEGKMSRKEPKEIQKVIKCPVFIDE